MVVSKSIPFDENSPYGGEKTCPKCQQLLPSIPELWGIRRDGNRYYLNAWCRPCERERARIRQAARRQDPIEAKKVKEAKYKHAKSEKGRKRKRELSLIDNQWRRQQHLQIGWNWSLEKWEACKAAWEYRCAYCKQSNVKLVHDHFIPLSAKDCPGAVPSNIVPACGKCNGSKTNKRPEQWLGLERFQQIRAKIDSFTPIIEKS